MNRCHVCGKFVGKDDPFIKNSDHGYYHFPTCVMYSIVKDESLEGRITRRLLSNSNMTITGEFTLQANILKRNVKRILKDFHPEIKKRVF